MKIGKVSRKFPIGERIDGQQELVEEVDMNVLFEQEEVSGMVDNLSKEDRSTVEPFLVPFRLLVGCVLVEDVGEERSRVEIVMQPDSL